MPATSTCCRATVAAVTGNEIEEEISFSFASAAERRCCEEEAEKEEEEPRESDCPCTTPTEDVEEEDEGGVGCWIELWTTADECITCSTVSNASRHDEAKRKSDTDIGRRLPGKGGRRLRRRVDVRLLLLACGTLLVWVVV